MTPIKSRPTPVFPPVPTQIAATAWSGRGERNATTAMRTTETPVLPVANWQPAVMRFYATTWRRKMPATRSVTTVMVKQLMVAPQLPTEFSTRLDPNEACDDGNDEDRDACRSNCIIAECGDGVLRNDLEANQAGFEACDDGNGVNTDGCLVIAVKPVVVMR